MRIQQVVDLSNLTRGQINQLISRHGLGVHGHLLANEVVEGGARNFTPADCFAFCVGGRAAAMMGCDMTTVRDIICSLPMPAINPATFRQREIFPGYRREDDLLLVVRCTGGEFDAVFVTGDKLHTATKNALAALVFPASKMARAIEDAADE